MWVWGADHDIDGGYPWEMNTNLQLLATSGLTFQALPCSGDVANGIIKNGGQLVKWYPF